MPYQIVITDSSFSTETPEKDIFSREGYELVRLQCRDEKELRVRLIPADAVLVQMVNNRLFVFGGDCQRL